MMECATAFAELQKDDRDLTSPNKKAIELKKLDRALTVALQTISELKLESHGFQTRNRDSYNWPVASTLRLGIEQENLRSRILRKTLANYPTDLIVEVRRLRDVARNEAKKIKPKKGNSALRNSSSARKARLAKYFVYNFVGFFGDLPPMSKTGPAIDLLTSMFDVAGENSDGVDNCLRRAIERYPESDMTPLPPNANENGRKRRK